MDPIWLMSFLNQPFLLDVVPQVLSMLENEGANEGGARMEEGKGKRERESEREREKET